MMLQSLYGFSYMLLDLQQWGTWCARTKCAQVPAHTTNWYRHVESWLFWLSQNHQAGHINYIPCLFHLNFSEGEEHFFLIRVNEVEKLWITHQDSQPSETKFFRFKFGTATGDTSMVNCRYCSNPNTLLSSAALRSRRPLWYLKPQSFTSMIFSDLITHTLK